MEIHHIKLGLNSCYLIKGDGYVMMDAGTPHKAGKFSRELKKRGIKLEEIKLIILSHSHFDHAGSAAGIQKLTGAKIAIHEKEQEYLDSGRFSMPKGVNRWGRISLPLLFPILKKIPFPKVKADILLSDQEYSLEEFGLDGSIFHTPGHTEGSVSILLKSGEAFVGCMAHNNLPFRLSPGLPIYAKDIDSIKKNWKILIEKGARMVYPGHGNPFPIEVIRKSLKSK
jgi:glyoxylase-like metal-dependent hydrolase (beta-lactamase superfamily II)